MDRGLTGALSWYTGDDSDAFIISVLIEEPWVTLYPVLYVKCDSRAPSVTTFEVVVPLK